MRQLLVWVLGFGMPLAAQDRTVVITVDDLPVSGPRWSGNSVAQVRWLNEQMIRAFRAYRVPAIGFVNEVRLSGPGDSVQRIGILRQWVNAGFELGNHTYSHPDLNNTPLAGYQRDVIRGEQVSRVLSEDAGLPYRYFRFPFTHTGPTVETRDAFRMFLADHDYLNAPFTIENADYMFNVLLADARAAGDESRTRRVHEAYLTHTETMFRYFEELSTDSFGREIPQILLIHVNLVNGDLMGRMLESMKNRGYRFVTLDEALEDSAYQTSDDFVGRYGPSWIHRYRVVLGLERRMDEPDPLGWVLEDYNRMVGAR